MAGSEERPYHHGRLREALLEAAESTVRQRGREKLSLRELARELGVSHAAPGRHFPDRQALLDALAVVGFERLGTELHEALDGASEGGFPARLDACFTACLRFATRDAALLELMFAGKHRTGAIGVREAAERTFGLLEDLMQEGEDSGELEPGSGAEVGSVLFATILGLASLANSQMIAAGAMPRLAERAMAPYLRGR